MRKDTLCFIRRGNSVLLGMKKVRFGKGYLNGFGGRVKEGETIRAGAIRETAEESGLIVASADLTKAAVIKCYFADKPEFDRVLHVFIAFGFKGEPKESDEMTDLRWYPVSKIPLERMWPADRYWLPQVLVRGNKLRGRMDFGGVKPPFKVIDVEFQETSFD